jgi:isoleucyl-tRNA synthetase
MHKVRDACSAALFIRNDAGIRTRQPLSSVTFIGVGGNGNFTREMEELVLDEVNVKSWINLGKEEIEKYANYKLQINFPLVGKRLPTKVKDIIAANKQGAWEILSTGIKLADEVLHAEEYSLKLEPKTDYKNSIAPLSTNDGLVFLDLSITEELMLEGIMRDIVRAIQQLRKSLQLNICDKIAMTISSPSKDVKQAISLWNDYIMEQLLCMSLTVTEDHTGLQPLDIEGKVVMANIEKA